MTNTYLFLVEISDYWEADIYKGFLIRHQAEISLNLTVELETWCSPSNYHAQVSKSNKIAKKIIQLAVTSDYDQKELISRNFPRILSVTSEPGLVLKLSGMSSLVENATIILNVVWIDPTEQVQETVDLVIEDATIASIHFVKSNLKNPSTGPWTVKVMHKKSLVGLTKFLIAPSLEKSTKDNFLSQNNIDKMIANYYIIKDTCIIYNHKNIREIVGNYLRASAFAPGNEKKTFKYVECKTTNWSSLASDPKSELI